MTQRRRPDWSPVVRTDTAAGLHASWPALEDRAARAVALCGVTGRPALVLGSTQSRAVVNDVACDAAGVDVVRRSAGGGAVLVAPGVQVWIDVWIPRRDPLWDDDVIDAAFWLGHVWERALGSLGVQDAQVHEAGLMRTPLSDAICFAGVGPGEVCIASTKLVGVAQRRTSAGARFHTMALTSWEPDALTPLLQLDESVAVRGRTDLHGAAAGLCDVVPTERAGDAAAVVTVVEDAFLGALP